MTTKCRCAGCLLIFEYNSMIEAPDEIMYCTMQCYHTQGGTI